MAFLILQMLFFSSVFLLIHSYIIYPLSMKFLASAMHTQSNPINYEQESEQKFHISCIISVYNEEAVIEKKLNTLLEAMDNYHSYKVYIGSDASTDKTNKILKSFESRENKISIFLFNERRGKSHVISELVNKAIEDMPISQQHLLLFTDANVYLEKDCLTHMIKRFNDAEIGLVDSRILQTGVTEEGISASEKQYMNLEARLKYWESLAGGLMMGAFGGCFLVRSNFYAPVPKHLLVDDFYISMMVLHKGGKCINELKAICREGVPHSISEEFKRKRRISSGNFQNLAIFYRFIFQKPWLRAYAFFSHKVLRWFGPLCILFAFISAGVLSLVYNFVFDYIFIALAFIIIAIPLLDFLLEKTGIHIRIVRNIRYFMYMNIALLFGFYNYLSGIKTSTWQPPNRIE